MLVKGNGKLYELPDPEPVEIKINEAEYPSFVAMKIHEKYSVDDELAILRQKDEKPEEYAEYFAFCEKVKSEVRGMIKGEDDAK